MENISYKEKVKYDFVFVVLVYCNTQDLRDFFDSLSIDNSHIIVVNSYYDEESENEFRKLAKLNNADFLSVPNKGYGAGNNRGVEYALENYDFRYLVISNADVKVVNLSVCTLEKMPEGIYAPSIHTLSGKQQNPHMPYHSKLIDKLKYKYFKKNNWNMIMFFCAINKIFRMSFLGLLQFFNHRKIYSAHGAFVILPKCVLERLIPLYDENVFLFTEEENLAMNAKSHSITTYFVPKVELLHKEDGSTSTISDMQRDITRESFMTFYKKWYQ